MTDQQSFVYTTGGINLGKEQCACPGFLIPGCKGDAMIEIALREVEKYYGSNQVLKGVSFEVKTGDRLGLLGKNGAGKTTVFRVITGIDSCDAGVVSIRKGAHIGMLDQFFEFTASWTVSNVLYSAYDDLMKIRQRLTQLERLLGCESGSEKHMHEYGTLQQLFEARQGYLMEQNIAKICTGLAFPPPFLQQEFSLLSGGEQTKVMLGRLLLKSPDILLLDEPTNHLDVDSIEWLEEYLGEYKGTVLIISHDRYFLNKVVTGVIEIKDGKSELYRGDYAYYVVEKEARQQRQLEQYEQEQKKIQQLEAAAKRLHEWGKQADNPQMHRQAFSIEKRIERMVKTEKPQLEKQLNARFMHQRFSSGETIIGKDLTKSYDGRVLLDGTHFSLRKGERTALLGENGSGKSTLLKIITGETAPDRGDIKLGASVRYGHLPQVITFENEEQSVLAMIRITLAVTEAEARRILAHFRFKREDVYKRLGSLSGGERSRLYLCLLMQKQANLLILDEPTNHLDIESREWLEAALREFGGTIFFVSHDRYFIDKFATRVLELKNGTLVDYAGGYEFFRQKRKEAAASLISRQPVPLARSVAKPVRSAAKEMAATREKVEIEIHELEIRRGELEIEMSLCSDNYATLDELFRQKSVIEEKIEQLYQAWLQECD